VVGYNISFFADAHFITFIILNIQLCHLFLFTFCSKGRRMGCILLFNSIPIKEPTIALTFIFSHIP